MRARFPWLSACAGLLATIGSVVQGADVDYLAQVKPLLAGKCYACHGALKQEGGLRLETRALILKGGDDGAVIIPGDAAGSLLLERITADEDSRMPPAAEGARLKPDAVELLRQWIEQGARAPDEQIPLGPTDHWSFRRIERPPLPDGPASSSDRSANPIDRLLETKYVEHHLSAVPAAQRSLLIRRLYLDLVGLPPSLEQLHDVRPWEEIVDELLASPHYGERWGRHWMDVWRYSDWYGLGDQLRNSQKHLWRWRDWIVESLNADKGYDRMILEMLAGDELAPDDPSVVIGTGFLARNYYLFNRTTWLDSTIEHTAKAFLGLTLNCAKCHDHKYDPISQVDYYNFRAFFEPHQVRLDPIPGVVDFDEDGLPRVFDDQLDIRTYLHRRGDPANPDEDTEIVPRVPAIFASFQPEIRPVALPTSAYAPGARDYVQQDHLQAAQSAVAQAQQELAEARKVLVEAPPRQINADATTPAPGDSEPVVQIAAAKLKVAEAHLVSLQATIDADTARYGLTETNAADQLAMTASRREAEALLADAEYELLTAGGDENKAKSAREKSAAARAKLDAVERGEGSYASVRGSRKALETPVHNASDYPPVYPRTSTGRRLSLARWITSRDNPLTARVAVNHVWMRHFGEPLVESVFDFGLRAKQPLHADLLDYLATEFIDSGWSFKHLHRLIVTSQTYQLSSSTAQADADTLAADPGNRLYWRMNARRMEAQVVRDSLLQLAGTLDETLGGPSLDVGNGSHRRSLYFKHSRDDQDQFLSMFDDADLLQCYRRNESIVPQQALALANSELSMTMAGQIAGRIFTSLSSCDEEEFATIAFETVLGRAATDDERAVCLTFCDELRTVLKEDTSVSDTDVDSRVRTRLVHSLLNHNDFISIR